MMGPVPLGFLSLSLRVMNRPTLGLVTSFLSLGSSTHTVRSACRSLPFTRPNPRNCHRSSPVGFPLLSSLHPWNRMPVTPRRSACRSLTSLPLSLRVRPVGSLPSRCAASVTRGGMRAGEERERRVGFFFTFTISIPFWT